MFAGNEGRWKYEEGMPWLEELLLRKLLLLEAEVRGEVCSCLRVGIEAILVLELRICERGRKEVKVLLSTLPFTAASRGMLAGEFGDLGQTEEKREEVMLSSVKLPRTFLPRFTDAIPHLPYISRIVSTTYIRPSIPVSAKYLILALLLFNPSPNITSYTHATMSEYWKSTVSPIPKHETAVY